MEREKQVIFKGLRIIVTANISTVTLETNKQWSNDLNLRGHFWQTVIPYLTKGITKVQTCMVLKNWLLMEYP